MFLSFHLHVKLNNYSVENDEVHVIFYLIN